MLDVDGVLVTGRPSDAKPWYTDLQSDLGIDPYWLRSAFFATVWTDIVDGRLALLPALQASLDRSNYETSASSLMDYWFKMDSRIDPAVLADLKKAKCDGLAVYLATNQDHCRADFLMNNMDLAAHVDGIIYSASMGVSKPHVSFYDAASKISGQSASSILLVDDTLNNVVAARRAGWHGAHWDKSQNLAQIIQDFA
jgi:putative hydrolase of the HAD superfamily